MSWNLSLEELRELEKLENPAETMGREDYENYLRNKRQILAPQLVELSDRLNKFFKQDEQPSESK